ncbi:MAG: guanylate kinase [Proteobacteria bacterium]|nr:guanylate kinase [Pseudomonadota bacterium]
MDSWLGMAKIKRRGLMFILSSPSGAGKTTLARMLLQKDKHLHTSISYTTRAPRPGERDGVDYYFTDRPTFEKMIKDGAFLEYAEFVGNYYGTPLDFVEEQLKKGEDVLFDIEWRGNRQLTSIARDDVVSVFIFPPSKQELLNRLRDRKQDSDEVVRSRMERTDDDLKHWDDYDYAIINRNLDKSLSKLLWILRAERLKKARRLGVQDFVNQLLKEPINYDTDK